MGNTGTLLHPLSLHGDYGLPTEPDYGDQLAGQSQHTAYPTGVVDQYRRDSALSQTAPSSFTFGTNDIAHGNRFVPDRSIAPDGRYVSRSHWSLELSPSFLTCIHIIMLALSQVRIAAVFQLFFGMACHALQ